MSRHYVFDRAIILYEQSEVFYGSQVIFNGANVRISRAIFVVIPTRSSGSYHPTIFAGKRSLWVYAPRVLLFPSKCIALPSRAALCSYASNRVPPEYCALPHESSLYQCESCEGSDAVGILSAQRAVDGFGEEPNNHTFSGSPPPITATVHIPATMAVSSRSLPTCYSTS